MNKNHLDFVHSCSCLSWLVGFLYWFFLSLPINSIRIKLIKFWKVLEIDLHVYVELCSVFSLSSIIKKLKAFLCVFFCGCVCVLCHRVFKVFLFNIKKWFCVPCSYQTKLKWPWSFFFVYHSHNHSVQFWTTSWNKHKRLNWLIVFAKDFLHLDEF